MCNSLLKACSPGIITLFLFLALTPLQANAQAFDFGFKTGINFTDFHNTPIDTESRTTFNAGGYLRFDLNIFPIALQPEIHYMQKGAKTERELDGSGTKGTLKTDYIEVPILARYTINVPGYVKPNLFFGPAISYLIRSEFEPDENTDNVFDLEESTNFSDFGLVLGIGIDFLAGSQTISVEGRLTRGYNEIYKLQTTTGNGEGGTFFVSVPDKHTVFSVMVGIGF